MQRPTRSSRDRGRRASSRRARRSTEWCVKADGQRIARPGDGRGVSLVVRERRRPARGRVRRLGSCGRAVAAQPLPGAGDGRRYPPDHAVHPQSHGHAGSRGGASGPRHAGLRPRATSRPRHADRTTVPRGNRASDLRHGLLLGRRADVLARAGHLHDCGRLRRRVHAEPDLPGGLHRPHRAQRGRPRRVRHRADDATRRCCASSGRATTRRRACARATTSAPSTAPGSTGRRRRSATPRSRRATCSRRSSRARATARSRPRSSRPGPFYYAEDYHQQYLEANPNGYCGLGGTGVSCPIGTGVTAAR